MEPSRQQIRFCTSPDAVRLAYAVSGSGAPLVKAANWLNHLEHDWQSPVWRHWWRELGASHRLVRYDQRGCGLSDRDVDDLCLEAWVRDLDTIVRAAKVDRFAMLGLSQGASICVAYAARHPEKVTRLILLGGYARGRLHRDPSPGQRVEAETMINIIRVGWGRENPAFRQFFSTQVMPEASATQTRWLNDLARVATSPENAARLESAFQQIDVTDQAPKVTAPTLVLHARNDGAVPFEEGRLLAALIPGARFVPLEGSNHLLSEEEPAWRRFLEEVGPFLSASTSHGQEAPPFASLTRREREVLDLVARGLSNAQIAARLFISPRTVRNHLTHIFDKLDVTRRAQAIVRARDAGFGQEME